MEAESSDSAVESRKLPQEPFLVTEDEPLWDWRPKAQQKSITLV